ncbi:MAG: hypothetical protein AB1607_18580 [Chloroflexota bacterium]
MKMIRAIPPARAFAFLFFLHVAVSMALFLLLLPALPFDGAALLDNTANYDSDIVAARLEEFGETGRGAYQTYLLFLDTPYALLTGAVLAAALRLISTLLPRLKLGSWVYAFPIGLAALDVVENGLLFTLLRSFPLLSESLAHAAGIVTSIKLMLVNVAFLLFLLAWVLLVWNWLVSRGTRQDEK